MAEKLTIPELTALTELYVAASNGSVRPETNKGVRNDDPAGTTIIRDAKECKGFMRAIERIVCKNFNEVVNHSNQ